MPNSITLIPSVEDAETWGLMKIAMEAINQLHEAEWSVPPRRVANLTEHTLIAKHENGIVAHLYIKEESYDKPLLREVHIAHKGASISLQYSPKNRPHFNRHNPQNSVLQLARIYSLAPKSVANAIGSQGGRNQDAISMIAGDALYNFKPYMQQHAQILHSENLTIIFNPSVVPEKRFILSSPYMTGDYPVPSPPGIDELPSFAFCQMTDRLSKNMVCFDIRHSIQVKKPDNNIMSCMNALARLNALREILTQS